MILQRESLVEISGLEQPAAIRRWLDRQGIPYLQAADGWPRVLQSIMIERLGGKSTPVIAEPRLRLHNV